MRGDFTRFTFRPDHHYSGVREQQGRVHLDADWNEQVDIATHRERATAVDVIGHSGGPLAAAAFALTFQNGDLQIGAGHYYVDGILCENEKQVAFAKQPDLPGMTLPTDAGIYLVYLDVWERNVTALEEPGLREVALGGPDTTTRTKTIWQVKLARAGDVNTNPTCNLFGSTWVPPGASSTGQLKAQAAPAALTNNECLMPAGAGYRRLENQLYRVEIQKPGAPGTATFKWSRDNGSIAAQLENIAGAVMTVSEAGKDSVSGFAGEMWVELSDEDRILRSEPGVLVQLASAQGNALIVKSWPNNTPLTMANFGAGPTVRRWDSPGEIPLTVDSWLDLEDGVQVQFSNDNYVTGDYWVIPARTLTGTVEWALDSANPPAPVFEPRHGIDHHFGTLGLWQFDGTKWTAAGDCRNLFPPVTSLTCLYYVAGDGQAAMPDPTQPAKFLPLAFPLQVGVSNGDVPVANAQVRFQIKQGSGQLQGTGNSATVTTGADGIASCAWALDSTTLAQEVEAVLLDSSGQLAHLPVRFIAALNVAGNVAYDPKACNNLQGATTVQAAIDKLCQMGAGRDPGVHVRRLFVLDPNNAPTPLRNDTPIQPGQMFGGIRVECDQAIDPASISRPTCFVTVEVPGSTATTAAAPAASYQTVILGADVSAKENVILWKPRPASMDSLGSLVKQVPPGDPGILTRLILKGNFIWSLKDPSMYLDGEAFGVRAPGSTTTDIDLSNGSGDGRRGGDFEIWFWLASQTKAKEKEKEKEKEKDKDKEKDKEKEKEKEAKEKDKELKEKETDHVKPTDKVKEREGKGVENLRVAAVDPGLTDGAPEVSGGNAVGRSFIRSDERPAIGASILDEAESEPD